MQFIHNFDDILLFHQTANGMSPIRQLRNGRGAFPGSDERDFIQYIGRAIVRHHDKFFGGDVSFDAVF